MNRALFVAPVLLLAAQAGPAPAQDAVAVDPAHYKVELENDQVRVLRVAYGPGEKSSMHSHPASVAIFRTDGQVTFTLTDGKTIDAKVKSGEVQWNGAGAHSPHNTSDQPLELILVELKEKPAG